MDITEVRVKLMEKSDDRLKAFCSITFDDCFVVRDLKIIEGTNGPFVAMPSRKLTSHCPACGSKNHLRAAHCNQCGLRLKDDRAIRDQEGRAKLYADIAHPVNSICREMIQKCVITEYQAENERAQQPGYVSRYDDEFDDFLTETHEPAPEIPAEQPVQAKSSPADQTPLSSPAPELSEEKKQPAIQRAHVEPAESTPRGPHKSPSQKPAQQQPPTADSGPTTESGKDSPDEQFGAGIF